MSLVCKSFLKLIFVSLYSESQVCYFNHPVHPAGNMLPHAALFLGHLHMHRPGSSHPAPGVRTGRLGVLSSLFSSGGGSFPLFEVRHAVLDVLLPVVRLPVPQHGLDAWPLIGQPLSATVPSTLSQWLSVSSFGLCLRGRW